VSYFEDAARLGSVGDDDTKRRTWEGLRADEDNPTLEISGNDKLARDADGRAQKREEAKWRTLFAEGLVNLESVPEPRDEVRWAGCDDVEVHVLLRAKGGASLASILNSGRFRPEDIVGACCRLASRGLLRFP
jgi:hypothetical protein